MKIRTNELIFREGYTRKDWDEDAKLMTAFMYLIPEKEQVEIADVSIKILNNLSYNHRNRVTAIMALYRPYMNEYHIRSLPKKNVAKFLLKIPREMLRGLEGELGKLAKKLK